MSKKEVKVALKYQKTSQQLQWMESLLMRQLLAYHANPPMMPGWMMEELENLLTLPTLHLEACSEFLMLLQSRALEMRQELESKQLEMRQIESNMQKSQAELFNAKLELRDAKEELGYRSRHINTRNVVYTNGQLPQSWTT